MEDLAEQEDDHRQKSPEVTDVELGETAADDNDSYEDLVSHNYFVYT